MINRRASFALVIFISFGICLQISGAAVGYYFECKKEISRLEKFLEMANKQIVQENLDENTGFISSSQMRSRKILRERMQESVGLIETLKKILKSHAPELDSELNYVVGLDYIGEELEDFKTSEYREDKYRISSKKKKKRKMVDRLRNEPFSE